jgi:dihydropteroate synthase
MGVCNRTPDSFSDGGLFLDDAAAETHVQALLAEGADIIDIGAESTRPGSSPVSDDEQITRIGPLVRASVAMGALVSIDTTSPAVAEHALREGARIVNTVSLEPAAELGALAARFGAALVLMHSRGSMSDMRGYSVYDDAAYEDVVADVKRELHAAADRAMNAGLHREALVLDPGLGFAKNMAQSLELCRRLDDLVDLGFPVLVGPSRKSFIARAAASAQNDATLAPPSQRLGGTIAAVLACVRRGARIVRVHDVAPVRQALLVDRAILSSVRA